MATKRDIPTELVPLLRTMWLIRAFEEKVSALYAMREIMGLLHLGIGQEAVAVGTCSRTANRGQRGCANDSPHCAQRNS